MTVTLAPGTATLSFWLEVAARSNNGTDVFRAKIDEVEVYSVLENDVDFPTLVYVQVTLDVSGFATGGSHVLKFESDTAIRPDPDSVTSFSAAPLKLATWLGMLAFGFCLLMMAFGVVAYASGVTVPGWASLFVAVLLLGGVQLVCLGLLGEYIARIYTAVQNRPTYLVAYDSAETPVNAE